MRTRSINSKVNHKLYCLEQSDYGDVAMGALQPPMVATYPDEQNQQESNHQNVPESQAQNDISAQDGIAVLKATYPDLDEEQIQTFYELNGNDVGKAKEMIAQQLGIFTEEEEQVDPEDVNFNMLAGQMDPNAISAEERKMIEEAIRNSEAQEQRVVRNANQHINQNVHAVNQAHINQRQRMLQQAQNVENQIPNEEEIGDEVNQRLKNGKLIKKQKKVGKDGNQC